MPARDSQEPEKASTESNLRHMSGVRLGLEEPEEIENRGRSRRWNKRPLEKPTWWTMTFAALEAGDFEREVLRSR
jgi:hypothetical protein